ncbi:uncharacterized protein LOC114266852 [Camellia sinensis]|uniref:uncharacterized protein LOC114266852 n=1 Tax=Camellia sinensis TaxID=4442 RepID=UPI001036D1E0|nr:uncharacterized protein LOC114266852 [Camellia sinensis]
MGKFIIDIEFLDLKIVPLEVSNEVLESGEETYFPALHVGLDNPSAMNGSAAPKSRIPQMVAQTLGFGQNLVLLVIVTAMSEIFWRDAKYGLRIKELSFLILSKRLNNDFRNYLAILGLSN